MVNFFSFIYSSFKYVILLFLVVGAWVYWMISGSKTALYIVLIASKLIIVLLIVKTFFKRD